MKIFINGEAHELEKPLTLEQLLVSLSISQKRVAVELNREIVPHGQYQNSHIKAEDRVEIVHAIGGG